MATDVYRPCPCGSGKKLKFCCIDIEPEMEKIAGLQESGQSKLALQHLEKLEANPKLKQPGRVWMLVSRASIQIGEGMGEEARQTLEQALELDSDNLLAVALYATAAFQDDGFEIAKPHIHKAFQTCAAAIPELISSLALGIANELQNSGGTMAVREHLALAMRTASMEDRQHVFEYLVRFDSSNDTPYPLRSVHVLAEYVGEQEEEAKRAGVYSQIGCWATAAERFEKLVEKEPENPVLLENLGLCRAWDGDEVRGAEALHKAATLYDDRAKAIECETMAQLLDHNHSETGLEELHQPFQVESVSRLLTTFDEENARLVRQEEPPETELPDGARPSGIYQLLDEPLDPDVDPKTVTDDQIRRVVGQVLIFDKGAEGVEEARAYLGCTGREDMDEAIAYLSKVGGDDLTVLEDDAESLGLIPEDFTCLHRRSYFHEDTPVLRRREFEKNYWENTINNVWLSSPLTVLDGKTPREAAGDESLKLKLTSVLYTLDAYCDQSGYCLDLPALAEELGLELLTTMEVNEDTQLLSISAMQLQRLPVESLSDDQLSSTYYRASLLHQGRFLYRVLEELLRREIPADELDPNKIYMSLADLSREQYDRDRTMHWIDQGKAWAKEQDDSFQHLFRWEMRELTHRLEDPTDPQLNPLVDRFWNHYGKKLPEVREYITQLLEAFGIEHPEERVSVVESGEMSSGGIWTPGSGGEQSGGGEEKKLWTPD